MAKSRKFYKLRRYKTRRNKIKRNKRTLRKGLRKRRKTKKLRGGMGLTNVKKRLSKIKPKVDNASSLAIEELETLKKEIEDLDAQPIENAGQILQPDDERYKKLKTSLKEYIQTVDTKIKEANELKRSSDEDSPPSQDSSPPQDSPPSKVETGADTSVKQRVEDTENKEPQSSSNVASIEKPPPPQVETGADKSVKQRVDDIEANENCKGPKVTHTQISEALDKARALVRKGIDCGMAPPPAGGRRKKTRKRRR